jgi:hypothetical protein
MRQIQVQAIWHERVAAPRPSGESAMVPVRFDINLEDTFYYRHDRFRAAWNPASRNDSLTRVPGLRLTGFITSESCVGRHGVMAV